jgi:hypothetical protein
MILSSRLKRAIVGDRTVKIFDRYADMMKPVFMTRHVMGFCPIGALTEFNLNIAPVSDSSLNKRILGISFMNKLFKSFVFNNKERPNA